MKELRPGKAVTAVTKLASERWKVISFSEKLPFQKEFEENTARYKKAMETYVPPVVEQDEEDEAESEEEDEEDEDEEEKEKEQDPLTKRKGRRRRQRRQRQSAKPQKRLCASRLNAKPLRRTRPRSVHASCLHPWNLSFCARVWRLGEPLPLPVAWLAALPLSQSSAAAAPGT
jgi:hypothetical protein